MRRIPEDGPRKTPGLPRVMTSGEQESSWEPNSNAHSGYNGHTSVGLLRITEVTGWREQLYCIRPSEQD